MADDQPMWGNNQAIAPTSRAAIVTVDLGDNFTVKESSNDSKFMENIEALTTKIDSQFKEIKGEMKEMRDGCNSFGGPHPSSECDDKPMGGPKDEKANYAYGGYRGGGYRGNYYGRSSGNWQNRQSRDANRNSQPREDIPLVLPTPKTKFNEFDFEKTMREFMSSSSKQAESDPPPLKAYKPKIPFPRCLRKEKTKERYAKFIDLIKEVRINVPLVDVLAGMPNYGKFLKDLVSNKSKMEQITDAFLNKECFIIVQKKFPSKLGDLGSFLISCTVAGSVEYLTLADLGEDDKVPLILGQPFLHTADAIIRVKNKELNLGVGDDRITFLIDKAMRHSYFDDDTCFRVDIINEITEE
nr:reverse transcriptase domain-containing protein [Tanacetum cinerariifolium]